MIPNPRKLIAAAVGVLALLWPDALHARKPYHDAFVAAYPDLREAVKAGKCNVCHLGNARRFRNDYGAAMADVLGGKKNLKEGDEGIAIALKEIETRMNADGKTFGELILAGKLPGRNPLVPAVAARVADAILPSWQASEPPPPVNVAPYIKKLASADPRERLEAATALGRLGREARPAYEALTIALADRDRNVRFVAAQALEDASTPEEKEPLEALVSRLAALGAAEKPRERAEAIRRLGMLGETLEFATPVIARELEGDPVVRSSAIVALGQIGPGAISAVPELGKIVDAGGEDESFEAAVSISHIVATDGVFVRTKPPAIAAAQRGAIARLTKEITAAKASRQVEGALALSRFGPVAHESVPKLTTLLESKNLEVVYSAARALASISHESRRTLNSMAHIDENTKDQEQSLRISGALIRLRREMPRFDDILQNGNLVEQLEAARVMATVDITFVGVTWRDLLVKAAKEPGSCRAAIAGLGRLVLASSDPSMVDLLDGKISSPEPEIRLATVEMLADLLQAKEIREDSGRLRAVRQSLYQFTGDSDPQVRAAVEKWMGSPVER